MFTGIVEELGKIERVDSRGDISSFLISAQKVKEDLKVGDSIAIDGVCLTVVAVKGDAFQVEAIPETLKQTTLKLLKAGNKVNLERPLKVGARLGGHFLSGHVDGVGEIMGKTGEHSLNLKILPPAGTKKYLVSQGSVGVDGISLTVKEVGESFFTVDIIPHTLSATTLSEKKVGDKVNIEVDLLGKYVENFINVGKNERIDEKFLKDKGFL